MSVCSNLNYFNIGTYTFNYKLWLETILGYNNYVNFKEKHLASKEFQGNNVN